MLAVIGAIVFLHYRKKQKLMRWPNASGPIIKLQGCLREHLTMSVMFSHCGCQIVKSVGKIKAFTWPFYDLFETYWSIWAETETGKTSNWYFDYIVSLRQLELVCNNITLGVNIYVRLISQSQCDLSELYYGYFWVLMSW